MQIVTNSGKTFNAEWVLDTETRNGAQQLTIQLPKDTPIEAIMTNLVSAAQIEYIKKNGVRTVYEGYTEFRSLIAAPDHEYMRLTLEKGAETNG